MQSLIDDSIFDSGDDLGLLLDAQALFTSFLCLSNSLFTGFFGIGNLRIIRGNNLCVILRHLMRTFDANAIDQIADAQLMHNVETIDDFTEYRELFVILRMFRKREKELAATGIFRIAMSERERAILMMVKRITRPFVANPIPAVFHARMNAPQLLTDGHNHLMRAQRPGRRASAHYDIVVDLAIEIKLVLEALASKFNEITHGARTLFAEQLNPNGSMHCINDCHLFPRGHVSRGVQGDYSSSHNASVLRSIIERSKLETIAAQRLLQYAKRRTWMKHAKSYFIDVSKREHHIINPIFQEPR